MGRGVVVVARGIEWRRAAADSWRHTAPTDPARRRNVFPGVDGALYAHHVVDGSKHVVRRLPVTTRELVDASGSDAGRRVGRRTTIVDDLCAQSAHGSGRAERERRRDDHERGERWGRGRGGGCVGVRGENGACGERRPEHGARTGTSRTVNCAVSLETRRRGRYR